MSRTQRERDNTQIRMSQNMEGGSQMDVDEQRRKREREQGLEGGGGEFHDPQQPSPEEDVIPVPTEQAPSKPLELGDLMQILQQSRAENDRGRQENRANFSKLEREMASTKREIQETKEMAAKATTMDKETQESMTALEKRVAKLEQGGGNQNSRTRPTGPHGFHGLPGLSSHAPRDWDQLGGDDGDTAVVGGFRTFASKEERKREWDEISAQMPQELTDRSPPQLFQIPPPKPSL